MLSSKIIAVQTLNKCLKSETIWKEFGFTTTLKKLEWSASSMLGVQPWHCFLQKNAVWV